MAVLKDDVRLKIERADKHLDDFHAVLRAFIDSNPYVIDTKRDPQTRCLVYYLVTAQPIPDELAMIASDILQNLRTALDYLVCAMVRGNNKSDKASAFPIVDKAPVSTKERAWFEAKTQGKPEEAKDVIRRIKPYKGEDDVLWRLHKLNNRDKHRLLFTVGAAFRSLDLGSMLRQDLEAEWSKVSNIPIPNISFLMNPNDARFPLKAGDELFMDVPDAQPRNIKFFFDVAIDEPGVVAGESLIAVLRASRQRVGRVVEMFAGYY